MQSRFRSRHKAGFGAARFRDGTKLVLEQAQSQFLHIFSLCIFHIYIFYIYTYIYIRIYKTYIYKEKTYIKNIHIYLYTHNQSLVLDTKHVLYWPVLEQIQFCSFDRRCKTCLDTKQVLYQSRFCNLTQHKAGFGAGTKPILKRLV